MHNRNMQVEPPNVESCLLAYTENKLTIITLLTHHTAGSSNYHFKNNSSSLPVSCHSSGSCHPVGFCCHGDQTPPRARSLEAPPTERHSLSAAASVAGNSKAPAIKKTHKTMHTHSWNQLQVIVGSHNIHTDKGFQGLRCCQSI